MNDTNHSVTVIITITECVSISAFASLVGIPIVIESFSIAFKICVIAAEIKKYNSIIKKTRKKHDKTVLLAKSKLNSIEALISKNLTDSSISHEELMLKEFYNMKEEIKSSNN